MHLKYALMGERLTAAAVRDVPLVITSWLLEEMLKKAAYLSWKAFSLAMAFSCNHKAPYRYTCPSHTWKQPDVEGEASISPDGTVTSKSSAASTALALARAG